VTPKTYTVGLFNIIGFVAAATLVVCLVTNGVVNLAFGKSFGASLSGRNEVPPVGSSGNGFFRLSVVSNGLNYTVSVTKSIGVQGVYIHYGKQGHNGPVVAILCAIGTAKPCLHAIYNLLSGEKGTIKSGDLQGPLKGHSVSDILLGLGHGDFYVNVRTSLHPSGELRGQISS
jgi:CHRD domain